VTSRACFYCRLSFKQANEQKTTDNFENIFMIKFAEKLFKMLEGNPSDTQTNLLMLLTFSFCCLSLCLCYSWVVFKIFLCYFARFCPKLVETKTNSTNAKPVTFTVFTRWTTDKIALFLWSIPSSFLINFVF
jgi:hypothetical protein